MYVGIIIESHLHLIIYDKRGKKERERESRGLGGVDTRQKRGRQRRATEKKEHIERNESLSSLPSSSSHPSSIFEAGP